jgi:hypothetical protein
MMQIEIVNLNDLVKKDHPYRKLLTIIDFTGLAKNFGGGLFNSTLRFCTK